MSTEKIEKIEIFSKNFAFLLNFGCKRGKVGVKYHIRHRPKVVEEGQLKALAVNWMRVGTKGERKKR